MHAWARERLDTQPKQTKAEEALIVCGGILKGGNDKSPQDWAFEKRIWSHIEMVQSVRPSLPKLSNSAEEAVLFNAASNMSRCYSDHGYHNQAVKWYQQALDGREKTLGKDHPSTLKTTGCLRALRSSLDGLGEGTS